MSDTGKKALLLIPAYCEGARIGSVIRGVKERYPSLEIMVVDDGSRDETRSQAIEARARVISHPYNLGYGVALQTGYKYALEKGYEAVYQGTLIAVSWPTTVFSDGRSVGMEVRFRQCGKQGGTDV